VFAVKRKKCVVVIKFTGLPVVEIMTLCAVGYTVDIKLLVMVVGMAFRTFSVQHGKPLRGHSVGQGFKMTGPATLFAVFALQFITGLGMVEIYCRPLIYVVTFFTIPFREIFLIHERAVDVIVASGTGIAFVAEIPLVSFLMAYKTRCCQMRSLQFETGFVMLFNTECK